ADSHELAVEVGGDLWIGAFGRSDGDEVAGDMALTAEPEHLFDQDDRVFTGTLVIKGEPKPIGAEIKQFAESVEHLGTVFGGHTAVDSGIDDESAAMSFFN